MAQSSKKDQKCSPQLPEAAADTSILTTNSHRLLLSDKSPKQAKDNKSSRQATTEMHTSDDKSGQQAKVFTNEKIMGRLEELEKKCEQLMGHRQQVDDTRQLTQILNSADTLTKQSIARSCINFSTENLAVAAKDQKRLSNINIRAKEAVQTPQIVDDYEHLVAKDSDQNRPQRRHLSNRKSGHQLGSNDPKPDLIPVHMQPRQKTMQKVAEWARQSNHRQQRLSHRSICQSPKVEENKDMDKGKSGRSVQKMYKPREMLQLEHDLINSREYFVTKQDSSVRSHIKLPFSQLQGPFTGERGGGGGAKGGPYERMLHVKMASNRVGGSPPLTTQQNTFHDSQSPPPQQSMRKQLKVSRLNESQELGPSVSQRNMIKGLKVPGQRQEFDLTRVSASMNSLLPQIEQSRSNIGGLFRSTQQEAMVSQDKPGNALVDHLRYRLPKLVQQAQQESWVESQQVTSTDRRRLNQLHQTKLQQNGEVPKVRFSTQSTYLSYDGVIPKMNSDYSMLK